MAARFCPVLFDLRPLHETDNKACKLPYRMVFAVATLDSIIIYDTQVRQPHYASNAHYQQADTQYTGAGSLLLATGDSMYVRDSMSYYLHHDSLSP